MKSRIFRSDSKDKVPAETSSKESTGKEAKKTADPQQSTPAAGRNEEPSGSSRAGTDPKKTGAESKSEESPRDVDRKPPAESTSSKEKSNKESDEDTEPRAGSGEPPKKHSHTAYVATVKSRAIEVLDEDSTCTYARLCRKSMVDEWQFTMYYRDAKTFYFTVYSWDPVDEKWMKSYTSGKYPNSGWNEHLRFFAAGKECTDLKNPGAK